MTTKKDNSKFWNQLNKSFGGKMFRGDSPIMSSNPVIPFPSPTLADASHYGGLPLGHIAHFYGPEGCGKTFFAMMMVKETMDSDPEAEVFWFDCEQSFNIEWAEHIGIDLTRIHFTSENVGADVFHMICGKPSATGKGKGTPGILTMNKLGETNVKLIVLDSIPALIPPGEMGRGMDEMEMAAMARFLPKALRVTSKLLAETNTAMICINHVRESMGDMVNKYTYPGGKAFKHYLSLNVLFDTTQSRSATLWDNEDDTENRKKVGHRIDCTIIKTRAGPNKWQARIWFDFINGKIAKLGEEVALLGSAYGVVERPNNTKWVYKDHEVTGKDNFFAFLDEHEDIRNQIVRDCEEAKARGGKRSEGLVQEEEV